MPDSPPDLDSSTDPYVLHDRHGPAGPSPVAGRDRASQHRQTGYDPAAADPAVVGDRARIVDLRALTLDRRPELASDHAGVGPDLHIVLEDDDAQMRRLHQALAVRRRPIRRTRPPRSTRSDSGSPRRRRSPPARLRAAPRALLTPTSPSHQRPRCDVRPRREPAAPACAAAQLSGNLLG